MSDSLRPHGLWPTRLLCPWNSPGKNTGVGSHSLLQGTFPTPGLNLGLLHCRQILYRLSQPGSPRVTCRRPHEVTQLCRTLCDPKDCSLPGSSVHAIFQAIVLEWIAISFSTGSSPPRDQTQVSCIVDRCFTIWGTREVWYRRRTLYIFQYTLWSFFGRQLCLLQIVSILCISFKHLYFSFFFITFVCILWWNKDLWDNSIVSVQNILRWTFIIWSWGFTTINPAY